MSPMPRVVVLIALASVPGLALAQSRPHANCQCVAKGQRFEHGQTTCLQSVNGPVIAECGMSQNVAAWIFTARPCPQS